MHVNTLKPVSFIRYLVHVNALSVSYLCLNLSVGFSPTRISRQAAFNRVIWSAIVSVVKPGSCLANSTVLMMHLVESSLNLSHRSTSKETLCSALLFCKIREQNEMVKLTFKNQMICWDPATLSAALTYCGIFSQLAERREGLLMSFPHSLNHLLCVWTQHVTLWTLLLLLVLLPFVPIISNRCKWNKTVRLLFHNASSD